LEFLIPHLTPRKTTSNFPETVEENTTSDPEDSLENSQSPSPLTTEEPTMDLSLNSNIQKSASNIVGGTVMCTLPSSECLKPKAKKKACKSNAEEMDLRFLDELKKLKMARTPLFIELTTFLPSF
jgi:hypothetical protein